LVGDGKPTSTRWYLAIDRDVRFGGATVFHSDDDGATWHQVLAFQGGGTPGYHCEPGDWSVRIKGMGNLSHLALGPDDRTLYAANDGFGG
jgi:hypothetical protein